MILFSHLCNQSHMSGAEKFLFFMLREWSKHYHCSLVVPNEGMLAQRARKCGFKVIISKYPLIWQLWDPGPQLGEEEQRWRCSAEMSSLLNLLHMHRPDAVIVNTCVNALPAMAASRLGIPVLWLITEVIRDGPWTEQAVSVVNRHSSWIAGISQASLQVMVRHGLAGKTMLLYPSWWPNSLHPDTWSANHRRLRQHLRVRSTDILVGCVVSDIAAHKGVDHFIEMGVRLCTKLPSVRFLIVGNPTERSYYDQCIQQIHQSGYASRFNILPFGRQIETFFPALDATVVPSLVHEGFGMTAMESMAFGKPVIAYRAGGLEEMLSNIGMHRLLVPLGNIEQLTAAVLTVVESSTKCKALGAACRKAVTAQYGLSAYRTRLTQMLRIMEPVLAANRANHAASRTSVPDGMLLRGALTPAVFLIEEGRKRPFASETALIARGYGWHQVHTVDDAMLQWFPNGDPL